jgi:hypothetical protein
MQALTGKETRKDLNAIEQMIERSIEVLTNLEYQPFDWAYNLNDVISVAGSLNQDVKSEGLAFTYKVGFTPALNGYVIFPSTSLKDFLGHGGTVIEVH